MTTSDGQNWSLLQWLATVLGTAVASGAAFVWRLLMRIEKLEGAQTRQGKDLQSVREAGEATMLRLAERLAQLHEDQTRSREAMAAMPTRGDLRELEGRLAVQLTALVDRIDRVIAP